MKRQQTVCTPEGTVILRPAEDRYGDEATYDVIHHGEAIGQVFKRSFTRERRTPGRRYVNARWDSPPRWTWREAVHNGRTWECDTRMAAIGNLLRRRTP